MTFKGLVSSRQILHKTFSNVILFMADYSIESATVTIGQLQVQRGIRIISAAGRELSRFFGNLINEIVFRAAFQSLYAGFINAKYLGTP